MGLNDISFVKGQGGLGRPLPGQDHISGLVLYSNTLPTGFSAQNRILKFFSPADAEAAGIKLSLTASTAATKQQSVWRYHINEFFRLQPQGVLYVGVFAVPASTYDFSEIRQLQIFANGIIRQVGVYKDGAAFASGDLTAIQTIATDLEAKHMPLDVLYAGDMSALSDLSTLSDLGQLTAGMVSAVIAQDGAAQGAALYALYGKSVTTLGALLGAVALSKVSESIAWVGNYNISNGTECDTIAFANGQLYSALSDNLISTLNTYRYIFLRKFVGVAGSYFNDNHTAIAANSDYAYINNNRTIHKAMRGVYASLVPELSGPLVLNADGTLADTTVAHLTGRGEVNLDQMVRDSELSAFDVSIDTTQNVQSTNKVVVAVRLVQIGTGRNIQVNIGFTTSI